MANGGTVQNKSKAIASMVIGIVIGVTFAAMLAWYMVNRSPATFKQPPVARETPQTVPPPVASTPAPRAPAASQTQEFEFYRVLPDKADGAQKRNAAPVAKPSTPPAVADVTPYIVQAGSFQNVADAEKLKAKLALAGMEASVQSVDLPGKGVWHRVRLGPYRGLNAANETIASLKSNGVANATAIHAQ